jgi:hypothetical protein
MYFILPLLETLPDYRFRIVARVNAGDVEIHAEIADTNKIFWCLARVVTFSLTIHKE